MPPTSDRSPAGAPPAASAASEQEFHDRFYDGEAERIFAAPLYRRLLESRVRFLRRAVPDLARRRVLSLGCGDGRRELLLAPQVGSLVGIDLSPVAIERAAAGARRPGVGNVECRVGDVEHWHDAGRGYDAVLCAGILHHLRSRRPVAAWPTGGVDCDRTPSAWPPDSRTSCHWGDRRAA
ncbi:MAG: class I SAM-dependent methyltransferase [Deltaproteobacteria bacterium]|nr:class I SAM-dependent methyltransferase [Deltaproteobacteria bacterium]